MTKETPNLDEFQKEEEIEGSEFIDLKDHDDNEIRGFFLGIEKAGEYDSPVAVLEDDSGTFRVWINKVAVQKLENLNEHDPVAIKYEGMKKTEDGKREYKDYTVLRLTP